MEIPPRYTTSQRSTLDLPDIRVYGSSPSDLNRSSSRSSSSSSRITPIISSRPMSIPNPREEPPPPPLPPPKHILPRNNGHGEPDIAQEWENHRQGISRRSQSPSIIPGSSLNSSFSLSEKSISEDRLNSNRRASLASTITSISVDPYPKLDEGYASATSFGSNFSKYHDSIPGRTPFQSSMHANFRSSSQPYDKLLIKKLESRRGTDNATPPRGTRAPFSSSLNDTSPTSRITYDYQQPVQKAFSMPVRSARLGLLESPLSQWAERGLSAVSPPSYYATGPYDCRSPSDRDEAERSPLPFLRHSTSGSLSNSEDYPSFAGRLNGDSDKCLDIDADFPMEETSGLQRLRINDNSLRLEGHSPTSAAGQKRRASSPPGEDGQLSLHTVGSASDLLRRRDSASRASPTPRLHSSHGSVSSIGSGPRNSSYVSNLSLAASSITSFSSYGRLSPGGLSPGGMSPSGLSPGGLSPGGLSPGGVSPRSNDGGNESPYTTSSSLTASPHGSVSSPNHQHAILEVRPLINTRKSSERNLGHVKRITTDKLHGVFMCECCPKKPKKFETEEELNAHEMEKQYECQYCKNRFKNKNEAERHQNSLHLRRHSWSCAALPDYSAAFHNSPTRPTEADACGYCGEEFLRTTAGQQGMDAKAAVEHDRETRIQHLVEVHKFRECNHAKKFFRADHFRQHLKHSHGGTSGKWTNMLENACMKDEPLPEPLPGRITEEEEIS